MSDDELFICGANCDGYRPSASDPLGQYRCQYVDPHTGREYGINPPCYQPRLIDQQVVDEVQFERDMDHIKEVTKLMERMGYIEEETW